jgi:hypothetical protein
METIREDLLAIKKLLVEGHDDMRNNKKKNVSSFGVSYYLLQVIIHLNSVLNKLEDKEVATRLTYIKQRNGLYGHRY